MGSFAEFLTKGCSDEDIPLLREFLSYDALVPNQSQFIRNKYGLLELGSIPTPLHWSRQYEWPWAIRNAEIDAKHTALDVGGAAAFDIALSNRCKSVVVLDSDPAALSEIHSALKVLGVKNASVVRGDASRLPFPDKSFDRVFCLSVLEHVESGHEFIINEIDRVLVDDGVALVTLDVAAEVVESNNFYIDQGVATGILERLGINIPKPCEPLTSWMEKEHAMLYVMLLKYNKTGGEDELPIDSQKY